MTTIHKTTTIHKITTIHTTQLQQFTWPTNNNYTQQLEIGNNAHNYNNSHGQPTTITHNTT